MARVKLESDLVGVAEFGHPGMARTGHVSTERFADDHWDEHDIGNAERAVVRRLVPDAHGADRT